ncbi:MAG: hypothetical protein C4518_20505 [Desulfobacteraceae bacterium]|nr:MAG: hypothetical protein C4518_20505 [Desulfobacteraceae bacterium]
MSINKTNKKGKKSYQKPEVKAIDLAAEEVLSVGCKTATAPGTGLSPITCVASPCAAVGS